MECASGAHVNKSSNFITMTRLSLQKRENQQFGTAFFPLMLHGNCHICRPHISVRTGKPKISLRHNL